MCFRKWLLAVAIAAAISSATHAAIIVDYDLTGLPSTGGAANVAASTVAPGVTADLLTRGPGIVQAGLGNGFSSDNFTLGSSLATSIANGDYYQFGFDTDATSIVSLTDFGTSLRRSAINGPNNFHLHASFDDFATAGFEVASWQYFGRSSGTAGVVVPFQWMTTDTPGQNAGNPITPQLLSDDPQLLAIGPNTSVTFRLYVWGNLAGAADSNTVALGRIDGPTINGTVITIPEPAAVVLVCGVALAGWAIRRRR
jgi:hypothetical protein